MIIKTLSNLQQLTNINGNQLLLARKNDKDYSLSVSSILNKNKNSLTLINDVNNIQYTFKNDNGRLILSSGNSQIGALVISEKFFENGRTLDFQDVMCPGIYSTWDSGWSNPLSAKCNLQFNLFTPYFFNISNSGKLYFTQLKIGIRNAKGSTFLIGGTSADNITYTYISFPTYIITAETNGHVASTYENAISDQFAAQDPLHMEICSPNIIRVSIPFFNNLRYYEAQLGQSISSIRARQPSGSNCLVRDTTCTVTIGCKIAYDFN